LVKGMDVPNPTQHIMTNVSHVAPFSWMCLLL
jgi:hypothetical protein